MKRIFFFSTKSLHTRNNSHFFAALRNYSKFFFLWLPKKWPERARERILSWSDRVATKILSQLTYWGCVLHQWVWGIEEEHKERPGLLRGIVEDTLALICTHSSSSTSVYSHMHLKIYIFPFLLFPPLLSHFTSLPHGSFVLLTLSIFLLLMS